MNVKINPDYTMALLGRRGSGKSTLLREICYVMRKQFPMCIVMTATKESGFFEGWVPPECVISGFHEPMLRDLIRRQQRIMNSNRGAPRSEQIDPRVLLILDDVVGERNAQNSESLTKIFVCGRHLHIGVIFTTQHVTSRVYAPILRNNSDLVFVFSQSSEEAADIVAGQWLCGVGTKRDALAHLHAATHSRPYATLVINARAAATAKTLADFTHIHVADPHLPAFRMGAPRWWSEPPPHVMAVWNPKGPSPSLLQRLFSMLKTSNDSEDARD